MNIRNLKLVAAMLFLSALTLSCEEGKINLFSVSQDVEFGQQMTQEILSTPSEYPILSREEYPEAYAYIEGMRDKLLATGEIKYADEFDWDVYIIDQNVLNAFAVPGGTTFYYSGLIKFLDNEASLAGVMAHEFAHADKRHSTNRMTKMYGVQTLLSVIAGEETTVVEDLLLQLGGQATALAFSRDDEYEADESAVRYLYHTDWDARGVAEFFEKMGTESDNPDWMVYFQTHPNPSDRIQKINEHHQNLGGKSGEFFEERYQELKNSLP
ncbi:M48 family metalloprotease [Marinilabilia salmonicolor]|uniref:M48 family metalloprotease n=1 Tax=Marinilabilia salmonicolor TaxID=989 RepID=UPI00029AA32B|nr:M48 family metalloprotease [Marinilabilia salmonicolor]